MSAQKLTTLYEIMSPEKARAILKKIEVVRTPVHASWLNVAECELSVLTGRGLKNRIKNEHQLTKEVKTWNEYRNEKQKGLNWQFTAKDARIKLK